MATSASGHITSGNAYDNDVRSCCGFAGSGNPEMVHAAYLQVDFDWKLTWDDPTNMVLTLSNLRFRQLSPGLLDSEYHWWFGIQKKSETLGRHPTSNTIWSVDLYKSLGGEGSKRVAFDYTAPQSYTVNIGSAWDWGFNDGGDMVVYFGGCSSYEVTVDPVYPANVYTALKSDPPIYTLLEYFPCAIRVSGVWESCNRKGGTFQEKRGGAWVDRKNVEKGDGAVDDTVFIKKSGLWVKSAKIGEGR